MKTYKVVLCDHEEGYVTALMNYMNRMTKLPVVAMAFTDADEMLMYLKEHKVDLILTERMPNGIENTVNRASKILYIYASQESMQEENTGIFKYSPASEYVRSMLQVFSEEEQVVQSGGYGRCIAVYSPHGRCGKTMLAKGLCDYYCRQSMQKSGSIYLGMEEYGCRMGDEHAMEELLYYIKQQAGNISMRLKALAVDQYGYDMIGSHGSYEELRELTGGDIKWFLETVRQEGLYESVIMDIGSGSLADLNILQYFDVVYLPRLQDSDSDQKWRTFCMTLYNKELGEDVWNRCYPVYIEKTGISYQEIHKLELKREQGELRTMSMELQDVLRSYGT